MTLAEGLLRASLVSYIISGAAFFAAFIIWITFDIRQIWKDLFRKNVIKTDTDIAVDTHWRKNAPSTEQIPEEGSIDHEQKDISTQPDVSETEEQSATQTDSDNDSGEDLITSEQKSDSTLTVDESDEDRIPVDPEGSTLTEREETECVELTMIEEIMLIHTDEVI